MVPGATPRFFCFRAEPCLIDKWRDKADQEQLVLPAEMAPLIIARWLWPAAFRNQFVLQFIDNDAARWAVIRGAIRSNTGASLADRYWELELDLKASTWTDRVRSASNLADAASRFDREGLKRLGFIEDAFPADWQLASKW